MAQTDPSSLFPRRTQKACCYTSAVDAEATYCGDCGKPLIRCMAAEECGGLLDDQGLCTVCVSPHLQVDAGALKVAKVGGAVSLPVSIANLSVVGRPIFVTRLWSREASGDWREESLGWERLDAGQSRPVSITANKIERAGAHSVEILVELASRWRWRQECYAFSAVLRLMVEGEDTSNAPVVTLGGESAGHGNTVYISGASEKSTTPDTTSEAIDLEMVRAEKEERLLGIRGIDENLWVPRNTRFQWRGFAKDHTTGDGPILTPDGLLAVGRARSRRAGGPGDIRLLAVSPDGSVDEDVSRLISRRHFELFVECNRLVLRINGTGGVRINEKAYGPGKSVALADGDVIEPIVKSEGELRLHVEFKTQHRSVEDVIISRSPADQTGG